MAQEENRKQNSFHQVQDVNNNNKWLSTHVAHEGAVYLYEIVKIII